MTANQRISVYYSYLLGECEFSALPTPVTVEDGILFRRCQARHSAPVEPPEMVFAKLHITDEDFNNHYAISIHIRNGKPVLIIPEGRNENGN